MNDDVDELVPLQPESTGPKVVSRFEFNLLRILKFLLGQFPAEQAQGLIQTRYTPPPPCLSANCVHLVKDILGKGIVQYLVRSGGWRRDQFLFEAEPKRGRVWERLPLVPRQLVFSRHPLAFLMWMTAEKPAESKDGWDAPANELTAGDELFFALAQESLRVPLPDVTLALASRSAFRGNPLCWLFTPGDYARSERPEPPNFAPSLKGTRAAILECLQSVLSQRWVRMERAKGQVGDWRFLRQQGEVEEATLTRFLAAANEVKRPDLARFVLQTASSILGGGELSAAFWTGGLQGSGPPRLADRLQAQRAALAVPRQVMTLQQWDRHARSVGYFDDDYPASQLWKADWEAARGDEIAAQARRVLESLEPLRT